ncbi:MAG: hypothetical protein ACM3Z4_07210 [Hyphomicrobiales bacterium]
MSSGFLGRDTCTALRAIDRDGLGTLESSPQAVSLVLGPSGEIISDTLSEAEGLLYQEVVKGPGRMYVGGPVNYHGAKIHVLEKEPNFA